MRVVEQVGRQGDDRLQPVVLQNPAADLRFARASAAVEQRRAGQHDTNTATAQLKRFALGQQVHQEQQRTIAHARQTGTEASGEALLAVLSLHLLLHVLPLHAERRVGQAVVELLMGQVIVRQSIAELDVAGVVALDQLVRYGDGIGLRVQLLGVRHQAGIGVPLVDLLDGRGQESASTGCKCMVRTLVDA